MAVIESKMYMLAIIGLLSTVISAFYYLRIIKIIYFDESKQSLDSGKSFSISGTLLACCLFLGFFFLYPSFLNTIVDMLVIN